MSSQQESRHPDRHQPATHQHIEQLLSNYRDLTPDEQIQIQHHLSTCTACRRRLAAFRQMDQLLQQSKWQTPNRQLKDGFYAAMDAERIKRPSLWVGQWFYISRLAGRAISLALLVVMVVATWLLVRQQAVGPIAVPAATPLLDANAMRLRVTLTEPGSAEILTLSQDGQFLATAQGSQVQIWATTSGRLLESLDIGTETAVDMTFTPNDLNLVVRTLAGQLQRWRVAGGTRLADGETPPTVSRHLPFATDNLHLAIATANNQVEIWEMVTGELKKTITNHDNALTYLGFSAGGELLLIGDTSGIVHVWDMTANSKTLLIGPQQPVIALAISPDGNQIAAGFANGQVKFWSHVDGTSLQTLPSREAELLDMHFSNDGDNLRRLLKDGTLERWPIGDDQPYSILTVPALRSGEFAFLASGLILAGITTDGSVALWDKPQ